MSETSPMPEITCAAIMAVRNEVAHVRRAIETYVEQGIDVVVIDNESTDDTREICMDYLGRGVIAIEHQPWEGNFDLSTQLAMKEAILQDLDHDWVIHADADEWLQSPQDGESLRHGLSRVSAAGFNAVNFDEFVFVPPAGVDLSRRQYQKLLLHYYYFTPSNNRLNRAWRRTARLSSLKNGGHRLMGNVHVAPERFILRHYIGLSADHILDKYLTRTFSEVDLEKGWHRNRRNMTAESLHLPGTDSLKRLPAWDSRRFDRSSPKELHFWEW